MKVFFQYAPLFAIFLIGTNVNAQEFSDPVQYFDYTNAQHGAIVNKNMEYIQYAVHSDEMAEIETKRLELIATIAQSLGNVKNMPAYKGDDSMKKELETVLEEYLESFKIDFNHVNNLKKESQSSYKAMETYMEAQDEAEKKIALASEQFKDTQIAFAKNNNITLLQHENNSEIEQLNQLNAYQRKVFLKYFRISKTGAQFDEALNAKEAERMEELRTQLLTESKQELKDLQLMADFNGDTAYRDSAIKLVQFYKDLSENGYKTMVEVMKKEQLSQPDVDAYNKVIRDFNEKLPALVNEFNQATQNLLRKNVPKPAIKTKKI